jgi:hypothetical protein
MQHPAINIFSGNIASRDTLHVEVSLLYERGLTYMLILYSGASSQIQKQTD